MSEEEKMDASGKKSDNLVLILFAIIGVPFVMSLVKFFRKGPNEPATMEDLLAIFGVQVLMVVLLLIYIYFFRSVSLVLG